MSYHVIFKITSHVKSIHVMSCHVMTQVKIMSCHVISSHMSHITCHVMSHVLSYHMSYHITCHVMLHQVMLHVMSWYNTCHSVSCHVISCHVWINFWMKRQHFSHTFLNRSSGLVVWNKDSLAFVYFSTFNVESKGILSTLRMLIA